MQVEYLEEFLELVNYMNFTLAARKLNLTQSALSKHVAALEKEFDVMLFDRSKQQIELTKQGRVFCEEASRILDAYRSAYRKLHNVASEVRVAGSLHDSAIRYLMAMAQDALRETNETLRVVSCEYPTGALGDALAENKIDLIVDVEHVGAYTGVPGFEKSYLTSVPLLAVVKADHPLAGRSSVTMDELADELIMHPTGSMEIQQGAQIIEAVFAAHGINIHKHIFYAKTWDDFATADYGDSVFVMPRSLFSRQLFGSSFSTLCGIPLSDPEARFSYCVVCRQGEKRSDVLRYLDVLHETGRNIDAQG